jgi:hypothetical protein
VLNGELSWSRPAWGTEATLLYNVSGRRIADVGYDGLPDVYEEPLHRLDLTARQSLGAGLSLKLSGTNLLAWSVVLRQGAVQVQRYQPGVAGTATLEWSY